MSSKNMVLKALGQVCIQWLMPKNSVLLIICEFDITKDDMFWRFLSRLRSLEKIEIVCLLDFFSKNL